MGVEVKKYFQLIRIDHWIKNILLFVPMFCGKALSFENICITILGFIAFGLCTSFVYIINDIMDIDNDKLHPRKKHRPLSSGQIKINVALGIAIILLFLSFLFNYIISSSFFNLSYLLLFVYIVINLFYSCFLKNLVIIDIVLLTLGFVLRIYYGASLINIEVSDWLFLTIMCGALFFGLGKRKKEMISDINTRESLLKYNKVFLDKFQYIALNLTLVFYSFWAMMQSDNYLLYTIPLVIVIFMRYCLIVETKFEGDPVTVFYSDKVLISLCAIYMMVMMFIFGML